MGTIGIRTYTINKTFSSSNFGISYFQSFFQKGNQKFTQDFLLLLLLLLKDDEDAFPLVSFPLSFTSSLSAKSPLETSLTVGYKISGGCLISPFWISFFSFGSGPCVLFFQNKTKFQSFGY